MVRYEPGASALPHAHVASMLEWIDAVPRIAGVERTVEAELRASTIITACAVDSLVGFAAVDLGGAGEAYVLEVHVHRHWRRRRLGWQLVEAVKDAAAKHGRGLVRLTVADDNTGAIDLYEKAGFKVKSAQQGYSILECCVG